MAAITTLQDGLDALSLALKGLARMKALEKRHMRNRALLTLRFKDGSIVTATKERMEYLMQEYNETGKPIPAHKARPLHTFPR